MNFQYFRSKDQSKQVAVQDNKPQQVSDNNRSSLYESVITQNPTLKQFFDFKTIIFSSKTEKYTPEECEKIFDGEKKVNLKTQVKFENGKLQLKRTQSEAEEMLARLKMMNAEAKFKSNRRGQHDGEYDYEVDDRDDDDYEDYYDDEEGMDGYGDDEDGYGYGNDDDDDYEYDEDQIYNDEDYYYKQMMKDMDDEIQKEIYEKLDEDMYSQYKKQRQNTFLSKISDSKIKQSTADQENSNSTNNVSKPKEQNVQKKQNEEEWETESDEWEDDDEADDEDAGDDEDSDNVDDASGSRTSAKSNNKKDSKDSKQQQIDSEFSSIKVCDEDYKD